jgi:transposase-like protein
MRKKGTISRIYSPEFKISVVKAIRENGLGYREAAREFGIGTSVESGKSLIIKWERIYLEEGEAGLMEERRGRKSTGRPKKLKPEVEEDLIAENQRLRAEVEYLKKLDALVQERKLREKGLK